MTVGTNDIVALSMAMDQPGLVAYRTDRIKADIFSPTRAPELAVHPGKEIGREPETIRSRERNCASGLMQPTISRE